MKRRVILIGRINCSHLPIGGETGKNQVLVSVLQKYVDVVALDFYRNKKRPWVYLQTLWALLRYSQATIILSTTASNIYPLLKAFKMLGVKRKIIHWIIGGEFDRFVEAGRFDLEVLNVAEWHLVQSKVMAAHLRKSGLKGVKYIPNFRKMPDLHLKHVYHPDGMVRFVYMSRIMKEKGVGEILQCAERLNALSYHSMYIIDFYGYLDELFQSEFSQVIQKLPNVNYKGVLNLKDMAGYEILASYHAMLFPTFHPSEGIAGAIIDAYIAGVPVIASDWNHNREVVKDGETGIIVPSRDTDALFEVMKNIIEDRTCMEHLAEGAKREAETYKVEHVINEELLKDIGVL